MVVPCVAMTLLAVAYFWLVVSRWNSLRGQTDSSVQTLLTGLLMFDLSHNLLGDGAAQVQSHQQLISSSSL